MIALYLCGFFAGGLLAAVVVHGVRGLIARPHRPYEPLADVDLRLRRIGDDYVAGRIDAAELEQRAQEVLDRLAAAERRADELAEKLVARGRPEAA